VLRKERRREAADRAKHVDFKKEKKMLATSSCKANKSQGEGSKAMNDEWVDGQMHCLRLVCRTGGGGRRLPTLSDRIESRRATVAKFIEWARKHCTVVFVCQVSSHTAEDQGNEEVGGRHDRRTW
jgi:hypothetical protein